MDNYDKVQIWNSKKENMACVLCSVTPARTYVIVVIRSRPRHNDFLNGTLSEAINSQHIQYTYVQKQ